MEVARSLGGVGEGLSRTSPAYRILGRLVAFGLARWTGYTVALARSTLLPGPS